MAHAAVNWAINEVRYTDEVIPAARWLFVMICDRANKDEWSCFPSHKTLAADAGMSSRSVLSLLGKLENNGLIRRSERFRENGTRTTDLITVVRPEDSAVPPRNEGPDRPQPLLSPGEEVAALNHGSEPGKGTEEANASVGQADEVRHAFELYNRLAEKIGGTRAAKLNDDRKRRLKARLKDAGGIEGWARALERIERSPFLTGQTHHHFSLTLDFLIQPSSFTKLIEGQYEDRNDGGGSPASPTAGADRGAQQHTARLEAMVDGAREALSRRRRWSVGG